MLPAKARLRSSADIRQVLQSGRTVHTPYVRLHVLARPTSQVSRVACIVGKKVSASAVARHRYQRWLRVIAKTELLTQPRYQGCDIVMVAKPGVASVKTLAQLRQTFHT